MNQKKYFLSALTVLFWIVLMAGQAAGQANGNYLGLFGGQNRSNLRWEGPDDLDIEFSTRNSMVYGGILGNGLGGHLDIQLEPSYIRKGAKRELTDPEMGLITSQINLSAVELPILLRFSLNKEGVNPYLLGGGTVAYLLKAEQEYGDDYEEFGFEKSYDIKDDLKAWDYGYSLGGGISIPLGGFSIFLEGRYNKGLADINDLEDDPVELYTEGTEYLAGVTFPIGGGVFFGQKGGAPAPKPKPKPKKAKETATSTRTRTRKGSCEIGAELGIRIINPLGRIISGKKKRLFNVIKPGVRVDSNCRIVVQAQNSAVCPYEGTVTFDFYRGDKGETRFHRIQGHVANDADLKALLDQPAPRISAPPGMSATDNRKVEFLKVVGRYRSDDGDTCSYDDQITVIWRYNGSQSAGTWDYLNPEISKVRKPPPRYRSRVRYNPEIVEEKTGFPGRTNHATEVVVDFAVDEAFGCCEHTNKHYAIIQFVRHRWQLGRGPVRNDAWNLDGPDSQADNHKAGRPYDPTYATSGSPLFSVGPWNQNGGDAISVRDYPGLFKEDHEKFMTRGGFIEWHFWTLLVCRETPATNEKYIDDGEVQAITHFTIRREYDHRKKKVGVRPSIYNRDRKYFDPCVPLRTVLSDRELLDAYNNPREHEIPLGD